MKFCEIGSENENFFAPYIPARFEEMRRDRRCLTFGMFEDGEVIGAAVLFVNNAVIEIRSLEYSDTVKQGECERALAEFITGQKWDVYRIEYSVGGTGEFFSEYDFTMLEAGFIPAEGNVKKFHATIGHIINHQGEFLKKFLRKKRGDEFVVGKTLTQMQVDSYNEMYPYNRYYPAADNVNYSCFVVKRGNPVAGITLRMNERKQLEFQWMDARRLGVYQALKLIIFATANAVMKCPKKTEVIICPFQREVEALIAKFGFEECDDGIETRIYSYYL